MKKSVKKIDDLLPHYEFDYSKAQPNIFASYLTEQAGYIKLQPDVRKFFKTSEDVNKVLRAIINAIPKVRKKTEKMLS